MKTLPSTRMFRASAEVALQLAREVEGKWRQQESWRYPGRTCRRGMAPATKPSELLAKEALTAASVNRLPRKVTPTRLAIPCMTSAAKWRPQPNCGLPHIAAGHDVRAQPNSDTHAIEQQLTIDAVCS